MTSTDLTTALARLLSDPALRDAFRDHPTSTVQQLGVVGADRAALLAMDAAALDEQAASLLSKRYYEVSLLIPETIDRLGPRSRTVFYEYAAQHWPTGHRRHGDDALAFCRYLASQGACGYSQSEANRLAFRASRRRWTIHVVRELRCDGRRRWGIQALYRRGGQWRQVAWWWPQK